MTNFFNVYVQKTKNKDATQKILDPNGVIPMCRTICQKSLKSRVRYAKNNYSNNASQYKFSKRHICLIVVDHCHTFSKSQGRACTTSQGVILPSTFSHAHGKPNRGSQSNVNIDEEKLSQKWLNDVIKVKCFPSQWKCTLTLILIT